jgi:predicted O-methyltransferase YrrM
MPNAGMQIGANQGSFMAFLVGLIGARNCLEIGTFTGYSALTVAQALPEGGRLICCDVSKDYTDIARKAWEEAGLAGRIALRLGPAAETLDRLIADGEAGRFDFAFIDADKENYDRYYEQCLILLRKGGLIAVDNMLWDGAVADPADKSESTVAIRALNSKLREDPRVDFCLIPVGDGIALARIL